MSTGNSGDTVLTTSSVTEYEVIQIWLLSDIPLPDNNWVIKWWKKKINNGERSIENLVTFLQNNDIKPIVKDHGLYDSWEFIMNYTNTINHYPTIHEANITPVL